MPKKLIYGAGINDADYFVRPKDGGKQPICQFYLKWYNMIQRCYDDKYAARFPTYTECKVCDEWLTFSNFKEWMKNQDWEGKQLDKDLIIKGNKIYSPETCAFVDMVTNLFSNDKSSVCGKWPLGVSFDRVKNKFQVKCSNPFTKKTESVGYFTCPIKAHQAWKRRKHELACQLADLQTDNRVASALRTRYL